MATMFEQKGTPYRRSFGGTMLIVAHRLSTIQHADNIILLSKGKIVEQGNHSELLEKKGHYHELYTRQYEDEATAKILA